jgi:alkylation response protein AidB-like acyl-CoA dehydrogenase
MALTDDERDELRATARAFLAAEVGMARVRALLDDPEGFDRSVWASMAELGWLAVHLPEEHGGMGATYTDLAVLLHEMGRAITPGPFLASAVLAAEALLGADNADLRAELLPAVAGGERIVTVANLAINGSPAADTLDVTWRSEGGVRLSGTARFVPHAHVADAIVVAARDAVGAVALGVVEPGAPGVRIVPEATVDQTRRLARVELDDVAVADARLLGAPGAMNALHERAVDVGAIAIGLDALGAAEHMLDVSSQYAKQRQQFGRPIGSFQAVKHHCANMLIAVEASRAATSFATDVLDDTGADVGEAASVVKSYGGPACADACQLAVQVHGGIGFTWEHDAHLYLKRTKLDEALYGSTGWHRRRLARHLLAD